MNRWVGADFRILLLIFLHLACLAPISTSDTLREYTESIEGKRMIFDWV